MIKKDNENKFGPRIVGAVLGEVVGKVLLLVLSLVGGSEIEFASSSRRSGFSSEMASVPTRVRPRGSHPSAAFKL